MASAQQGASVIYDPRTFGCPWDGIHDDAPGWDAMMRAIPALGSARIELPMGMGYFSRDVNINREVHIVGRGGGSSQYPNSGFRLAPLRSIVFHALNTSSDGNWAAVSVLEYCDIQAKAPLVGSSEQAELYLLLKPGVDIRRQNQFVEAGTCVISASANFGPHPTQPGNGPDVMFRATVGGTTGEDASEPAGFASTTIGFSFTDGGVTWAVEAIPRDWRAATAYVVGQRVVVPGDNRFVYEVVSVAGDAQTGSAMPVSFNQPWFQTPIVDNNVTWKVLTPANIKIYAPMVRIAHFNSYGGMGFAVHADSGLVIPANGGAEKPVSADFTVVEYANIYYAGGGVHFHGQDGQGGSTSNVRWYGTSSDIRTQTDVVATSVAAVGATSISVEPLGLTLPINTRLAFNIAYLAHTASRAMRGDTSIVIAALGEDIPSGARTALGVVTAAPATAGDTSISVEPLQDDIDLDTNLIFSKGLVVHTEATAQANPGDRSVAVSALGDQITPGSYMYGSAGNGEIGIWDRSQGGNSHIADYTQFSNAPGFVNDYAGGVPGVLGNGAGPNAVYLAVRSECRPSHIIEGVRVGDDAVGNDADSNPLWITPGGSQYLVGVSPASNYGSVHTGLATDPHLDPNANQGIAALSFWSQDEISHSVGWYYNFKGSYNPGGDGGTGWYTIAYSGSQNHINAVGISGKASSVGPGHWREYQGKFVGTETKGIQYRGVSSDAIVNTTIRGGHYEVGDKFQIESAGTPGTWDEYVVSTAGYRGVTWVGNGGLFNTIGDAPSGISPTLVEPSTSTLIPTTCTPVFKCIEHGCTGASQPLWCDHLDGVPFTDGTVTWQYVGRVPEYKRGCFIDDPVTGLTPQTRLAWQDTAATDTLTAAPKAKVDSYRRNFQTTTNKADQPLFTTDGLADDSVSIIDVTITGKQSGDFAEAVSAKLSGTYYRNKGGAPIGVGVDDMTSKGTTNLGRSTFNLNVNGNAIEVRVTPGVDAVVDWGVFVNVSEGKS